VQADLGKHLQEFERTALRTSLSVPAGLILDKAALAEGGPRFTAEDEQRVDSQLAALRQEIQQVLFQLARRLQCQNIIPCRCLTIHNSRDIEGDLSGPLLG
jgi:hypothetical protein